MNYYPGTATTTYRFAAVKHPTTKTGKCPVCGKTVKRSRTFEQTLSPFNKNKATGELKTRQEIGLELKFEAEAWVPDYTHAHCRPSDPVWKG